MGDEELQYDEDAVKSLSQLCEKAKIELSEQDQATIQFQDKNFVIGRQTFEELALPVLAKLEGPVRKALDDAALEPEDIDEILLVGGSCRIPWVKNWLKNLFGKEPNHQLSVDTIVA